MSLIKRQIEEREMAEANKLEGYRKMLHATNTYEMECPHCNNALSIKDISKSQCLHCGYEFPWKKED